MVLPATTSQKTTYQPANLSGLPLELLFKIIHVSYWDYHTIVSLLQVSRALYERKEAILIEHLKAQGIDYVQLERKYEDAILPVEMFYRCYQKSRLFADIMAPHYKRGRGYYIPPETWQVNQWPDTTLVHPNTLVVLLVLGNVACFQSLVQQYSISARVILNVFNQTIFYEGQLPFSIQSSVIEAIAGLVERMEFVPDDSLLETSIRQGCGQLTYALTAQYHLRNVSPYVASQAFVYSYYPKVAKRQVWERSLNELSLKQTTQDSDDYRLYFQDALLKGLYNERQCSDPYVHAILSKFICYRYPGNRAMTAPTLGLMALANDHTVLAQYVAHITEKEYVDGNVALLMYAIAVGNAELVDHLTKVCRIPVTLKLLFSVVTIMAHGYEAHNQSISNAQVAPDIHLNSRVMDDLFCTLLKECYSPYLDVSSLEEKKKFIVNMGKSNLFQSGDFFLSQEKNKVLHSEDFGLELLQVVGLREQSNNILLVQFLIRHFPYLLTDPDLMHGVVSVGDHNTMWYLINTYRDYLPVDIADIVRVAFSDRQLPLIQSIVERNANSFKAINWGYNVASLLKDEVFIETADNRKTIDIERLKLLHYLLTQQLVEPCFDTLEDLLHELTFFHSELRNLQRYMSTTNVQAAYLSYATLLIKMLDQSIAKHFLDLWQIEIAIQTLKRLIQNGMLFEVLNDWLVKGRYPHVETTILGVEPSLFVSQLLGGRSVQLVVELIGSDLEKLEALHTLIEYYQIHDANLISPLLNYIVQHHAQRADWVQLLIAQCAKVSHITWEEQNLIKSRYQNLGAQWLQCNYSDRLGPSVVEYLQALRM